MNRKQFATFAMALKTYFPRENLMPNEQAMELWFNHLKNIPYEVAELALQRWVNQNKWSPSIAEIRAEAKHILWRIWEEKGGAEALEVYEKIRQMELEENEVPSTVLALETKEES